MMLLDRGAFLLVFSLFTRFVMAERNVTVDDFDRVLIAYAPLSSWSSISDSTTRDRYLETTTFTRSQGAFASFSFGGATAIYFGGYGEIDADPGTFQVDFDGVSRPISGNNDKSRPAQQILFYQTGLNPKKNYTVVVRKTSVSGAHDLNVDFFRYTVPDSPATTSAASAKPTDQAAANSGQISLGGIVGGIVGGFVLLVSLVILFFYLWRRKRRGDLEKLDLSASPGRPTATQSFAGPPYHTLYNASSMASPPTFQTPMANINQWSSAQPYPYPPESVSQPPYSSSRTSLSLPATTPRQHGEIPLPIPPIPQHPSLHPYLPQEPLQEQQGHLLSPSTEPTASTSVVSTFPSGEAQEFLPPYSPGEQPLPSAIPRARKS